MGGQLEAQAPEDRAEATASDLDDRRRGRARHVRRAGPSWWLLELVALISGDGREVVMHG